MFSPEEFERYARHIILPEIGGPGQQKLAQARVLAIGAGGLGAPLLHYLAAAGVGTIGIVDDDVVSLSNLQRQTLYGTSDIGLPKAGRAAAALRHLNPHIAIESYQTRLSADNALSLICAYDVIADGSDNFATRYLVSDTAFYAQKPLVTGSIGRFDGSLTTLRPFEKRSDGQWNPSYRCLFPEPPPEGSVPSCQEAGVLGPLPGAIGALMAQEVIRQITPFGQSLVGRLLLVDLKDMRFQTLSYAWDSTNPLNGATK